jgi:hypothetical protein
LSRPAALALAAVLAAAGATQAWRAGQNAAGIDFYQYWVVGHALLRGDVTGIYDHGSRAALGQEFLRRAQAGGSPRERAAAEFRRVLEPMSTPFLFTALAPFALLGYDAAFDTFRAALLLALALSVFLLGRLAGFSRVERFLLLAFLVFVFQPVSADLRVGNVGQLGLGMVASFAVLAAASPATAYQFAAGAVLAAAAAFKPNLAAAAPLLLCWWAMSGQRRRLAAQAAGMLAGAVAAVLVSGWVFGSLGAWADWIVAVREGGLAAMPVEAGNVSPLALARRGLGVTLGPLPLLLASAAALWAGWRGRQAQSDRDLPVLAAGCLILLLASPLVWLHYLCLAVPAVIVALGARSRRRWLGLSALVAIASDPWADVFGVHYPVVTGTVTALGAFVLFALMLAELSAPLSAAAGKG